MRILRALPFNTNDTVDFETFKLSAISASDVLFDFIPKTLVSLVFTPRHFVSYSIQEISVL